MFGLFNDPFDVYGYAPRRAVRVYDPFFGYYYEPIRRNYDPFGINSHLNPNYSDIKEKKLLLLNVHFFRRKELTIFFFFYDAIGLQPVWGCKFI